MLDEIFAMVREVILKDVKYTMARSPDLGNIFHVLFTLNCTRLAVVGDLV